MPALAAVAAILAYGLMSPLLGVLLPLYSLNREQQGKLTLANALGLALASLAAGPMTELLGKKAVSLMGLSAITAALLLTPQITGYDGLLALFLSLGLGGGMVATAANATISESSAGRRGAALNLANLGFGVGGIATTYAASYWLQPRPLCYAIAGAGLAALLLNGCAKLPGVSGRKESNWARLLTNPALVLLSLCLFLYVACEVGVWNWLKAYLITLGFSMQKAGGIVSYGFASGIALGRMLTGAALKRVEGTRIILVAGSLIAVATFALLYVRSPWSVTAIVFGAGLAMAPVFPTLLGLVGDRFPRDTATAMGLAITSGWLGLAVSSTLIGKVAEKSGLRQALLFLPGLAACLVLVNVVLRGRLKRVGKHTIVGAG